MALLFKIYSLERRISLPLSGGEYSFQPNIMKKDDQKKINVWGGN